MKTVAVSPITTGFGSLCALAGWSVAWRLGGRGRISIREGLTEGEARATATADGKGNRNRTVRRRRRV